MITSSNFFKKTFFTIQQEQGNQIKKQISPWQQSQFPKFSTVDHKQRGQINRPYSLLQHYDPSYIDTRRRVQHLRRRCKREFKLQQFSEVLHIKPKQKPSLSYQTFNNQQDISLPQLRINPFGSKKSNSFNKGIRSTLNQLEQTLRKLKNPYDNDLNFIRKNQNKKQILSKDIRKQFSVNQKIKKAQPQPYGAKKEYRNSFDIYEKCIKSNQSLIHLQRDLQVDLFKTKKWWYKA